MITYKELRDFCEKNSIRFEMNPIYSKPYYNPFSMEETRFVSGYEFGMNNIAGKQGKSEWQWVWFQCFDEELKDDSTFYFRNRYSQVNGKNYKGIMEGCRIESIIEKRMN